MKLSYEGLISLSLSHHTRQLLNDSESEKVTYYINELTGLSYIDSYINEEGVYKVFKNYIKIDNLGHSEIDKVFIRSIFNRLDSIIDLDFEEMSHNNGSQIDIYSLQSSSSMNDNLVGQAIAQSSKDGFWWDILWRDTNNKPDTNSNDKNTFIHELGHALGLSHPFEDPFNESWSTNDTVMSYNQGDEGWNTWYSDDDIKALLKIWGREDDTGEIKYTGKSNDYKFKKSLDYEYLITTNIGNENITNVKTLKFSDKILNVENDIKGVFNQIKAIDDITGQVYRLYNASFNRFPDTDGLKYWINKNQSNQNTFLQTGKSFIISEEFISKYGENISNIEFINNLYLNILDRDPDDEGFNYWIGQLNNNLEEKVHLLLGFSESIENKEAFKLECGFK